MTRIDRLVRRSLNDDSCYLRHAVTLTAKPVRGVAGECYRYRCIDAQWCVQAGVSGSRAYKGRHPERSEGAPCEALDGEAGARVCGTPVRLRRMRYRWRCARECFAGAQHDGGGWCVHQALQVGHTTQNVGWEACQSALAAPGSGPRSFGRAPDPFAGASV